MTGDERRALLIDFLQWTLEGERDALATVDELLAGPASYGRVVDDYLDSRPA